MISVFPTNTIQYRDNYLQLVNVIAWFIRAQLHTAKLQDIIWRLLTKSVPNCLQVDEIDALSDYNPLEAVWNFYSVKNSNSVSHHLKLHIRTC